MARTALVVFTATEQRPSKLPVRLQTRAASANNLSAGAWMLATSTLAGSLSACNTSRWRTLGIAKGNLVVSGMTIAELGGR